MQKKLLVYVVVVTLLTLMVFLIHKTLPKPINESVNNPENKNFFVDVSDKASLAVHAKNNGVAWDDFDNDGFDDVFISTIDSPSKLFNNVSGKKFEDVTDKVGIGKHFASSGVFVDLENDGDLDFLISAIDSGSKNAGKLINDDGTYQDRKGKISSLRLYRNDGGVFSDITEESGLNSIRLEGMGTAVFGDIDNDGFLDLFLSYSEAFYIYFLSNLMDRDSETLKGEVVKIGGRNPSVVFVQETLSDQLAVFVQYPGSIYLFKNAGGRKFIDYSSHLPKLKISSGKFFQPVFFDFDNDGLQDIFIASDVDRSFLLKNKGNFTFLEVGEEAGFGEKSSWMGVDVGDYDNDGLLDLYVTNVRGDGLFKNQGLGKFELVAKLNRNSVGWGTVYLDFDNDGRQDIFVCNGDTGLTRFREDIINKKAVQDFTRQNQLYRNSAEGFIKTGLIGNKGSCKGAAISDFDNNGFPDIYAANIASNRHPERSVLYKNLGNNNSWIKIKLEGKKSNKFGVGAKIQAKIPKFTQTKLVTAGNSFY